MSNETKPLYEFGPYRLDPDRKLLLRNGDLVAVTSKALEILLVLVEHSEQVVTKDELMKEVWPNSFVEEANLTQQISMVRKALGEGGKSRPAGSAANSFSLGSRAGCAEHNGIHSDSPGSPASRSTGTR